MNQLSMTGDDWLSDRDRKQQLRAEAARKKTGVACAKALEKACDALSTHMMACLDCDDASSPRRADDGRTLLMQSMREYAGWLEGVYEK